MGTRAAAFAFLALFSACGGRLDFRAPLVFAVQPGVDSGFAEALRTAASWLPPPDRSLPSQLVVVELAPDDAHGDAWVDSLAPDRIILGRRGAAYEGDRRLILMAHELGHCLGAGHVPACEGRNIMAQGCEPSPPRGYSAADAALIER